MDYKNMNIFCITNNKGGVAKTTSTVDLAYAIADKGFKVLVVDTDPQCNSTYSLLGGLDQSKTLFEILINNIPMEQTIVPTKHKNLFVVPCSINLSAADLMLASAHGRERKLEKAMRPVKDFYDFIIIDTPPPFRRSYHKRTDCLHRCLNPIFFNNVFIDWGWYP